MFARKFNSDGEMRWPRPCRAKNATSLPASFPTTYTSEGAPQGVSIVRSSWASNPGIEYNPLPPIIPIVGFIRDASCLYQFEQHASCGRRMHKSVEMPACAGTRLVQNAGAGGAQPLHRGLQIRHAQRYVMQALAARLNKFGDDGVGLGRLQQFDA